MGWFILFRVTLRLDNIIYSVLVLFHKVSHCCLMLPVPIRLLGIILYTSMFTIYIYSVL